MSKLLTMRIILAYIVLNVLAACGGGGGGGSTPAPPPPKATYQSIADNATSSAQVSGAVLYIEHNGTVNKVSSGLADISQGIPITTDAVMPVASNSKSMIALLAAMLEEDSLLSLDANISDWIDPAIISRIENGNQITLRQMLNHTSGIYNSTENLDLIAAIIADPTRDFTNMEMISFGLDQPADFAPGTGWHYSNTGYMLAGLILDAVLMEHHSAELRVRILDQLGMINSFYLEHENDRGEIIHGYVDFNGDGILESIKTMVEINGIAAGPIASTVTELAYFLQSLINDAVFMSASVRSNMLEQMVMTDDNDQYGLGIYKVNHQHGMAYTHGGNLFGYLSNMWYFPDKDITVIAFMNCGTETCQTSLSNMVDATLDKVMSE